MAAKPDDMKKSDAFVFLFFIFFIKQSMFRYSSTASIDRVMSQLDLVKHFMLMIHIYID
jgi:hypothetical protein